MNLRKLVSGNKNSWDKFVKSSAPGIGAAARYTLRRFDAGISEDDINEVISEVFLKLVKNEFSLLRRFDPKKAGLATWLSVITRSTAIDFLRRRPAPELSLNESIGTTENEAGLPPYPSHILTMTQNKVMHLLVEEGQTVSDTARNLGITDQSVRSTKYKAVERLRTFYGVPTDSS